MATLACEATKFGNPTMIDTLAAAHAEAGDFSQAIKYQQMALSSDSLSAEARAQMRDRLGLYQRQMPYRE